jgi:hypothetical protein
MTSHASTVREREVEVEVEVACKQVPDKLSVRVALFLDAASN